MAKDKPKIKWQITQAVYDGQKTDVVVLLNDGKGNWEKRYTYRTDEVISKERVENDLKREIKQDLKLNTPESELQKLVGKEFNLDI